MVATKYEATHPPTPLHPAHYPALQCKVLEQYMHAWLWDIMKDKVDPGQFGAIKESCTTCSLI